MLKRYALFAWVNARGGWFDLVETYDRLDDAKIQAKDDSVYSASYQIIDLRTGEVVAEVLNTPP